MIVSQPLGPIQKKRRVGNSKGGCQPEKTGATLRTSTNRTKPQSRYAAARTDESPLMRWSLSMIVKHRGVGSVSAINLNHATAFS